MNDAQEYQLWIIATGVWLIAAHTNPVYWVGVLQDVAALLFTIAGVICVWRSKP